MGIDRTIKKRVIEDWQNAFPQLTMYTQNKFYKVVGCCVVGIELIKSPHTESYSPYFVIYPIWKKDIKTSLVYPIFLRDFKNKKGYQYDIPYEKHSLFLCDVLDIVKNQIPLPFDGNISLANIVSAIDDSSKKIPLSAAPNSYLQALLQESKLKIALFISIEDALKVLVEINNRSWDIKSFKMWNIDFNNWLQSLQITISRRDEFLIQIEANKKDKKISQLRSSELTG